MTNIQVTEQDVLDQLSILDTSKAYGVDGIPPKILKEGRSELFKPLCNLFNFSLEAMKVPSVWKKSNIVPIHKKNSMSDLRNYRPVSLLCCLSKVMERIVFKYIFNFFKDNFVLSDDQSGFQPGRSTTTQLIEIYHELCKSLDSGKEVRVVFLDISKAFDRVWHLGLIYKLKLAGINGNLLGWSTDYLSDRYQRVVINGQYSDWGEINAGVPQGSVLGPLLFLIFINDIVLTVSNCNIRLFADDTCLFLEVDNRTECATLINEDLKNIATWAKNWFIDFSATKTKSLTVSNKRDSHLNPAIIFKEEDIEEVSSHTYLGVQIANNLKWKDHISNVATKARKKLNLMLPLKFKLDRKSLEIMYKSFVRSTMDYASVIWGGSYKSDIDKLEKVQIDAMRLITGATARSNIAALYVETHFQTVKERIDFSIVCMMYKLMNGLCPSYLHNLLLSNPERERYSLRSQNKLQLPFCPTRVI